MITEFILSVLGAVPLLIFSILPDLPPFPSEITDGINDFVGMIGDVVGVISYLYTPTIFGIVLGLILAILTFEQVYHLALWVYKKIRG